jgi:hypothetical protein
LLEASDFPNPVGHQAYQPRGKLRHLLYQVGKQRSRKPQNSEIGYSATSNADLLHAGERQNTSDVARFTWKYDSLPAEFASPLSLTFKKYEHPLRWIALPNVDLSSRKTYFFGVTEEPRDLIVGQIGKRRNMK